MAEATIPTSDPIIKAFEYQLQRLTTVADELDILIFKLGRILIPAAHRHLLHLTPGQDVILQGEEGELRIRSSKESAKRARDLVKQYNPDNKDLVALLFPARKEDKSRG